jgi:hypothetical protein
MTLLAPPRTAALRTAALAGAGGLLLGGVTLCGMAGLLPAAAIGFGGYLALAAVLEVAFTRRG